MIDFKQITNTWKKLDKCDALLVVVLFVLIDLAVGAGFSVQPHQERKLTFDEPYRSRSYWVIKDFLQQPFNPDFMLFGASDVASACTRGEATYLNEPKDELITHRSSFLEKKLQESDSPYKTTFCLAVPGEMPSDTYFLYSALFDNRPKPKAIFLSFTPRNLCDATFSDPANTDVFKILSKLGGLKKFQYSARGSMWDSLDYLVSQASSIYNHKWEFASWQHHTMQSLLSQVTGKEFSKISTPKAIRKLSLLELPEDFALGESVEPPYDPKTAEFKSNKAEYQSRYRQFRQKTFDQQISFFKKFCQQCRNDGVYLVVGNTPMTPENRELLPKPIYDKCIAAASSAVRDNGGTWVNLDRADVFQHDDFYDSIHLNGKGAEKYMQLIATEMAKSSSLAQSGKAQPY